MNLNVSVIIPVYNAAPFLESAVESALQHPEVQEVVLVEDGSSDNSLAVAQKITQQYPKVKLYQHPKAENRGAGASRNLGMEKATQEYIAFLDADDVFTHLRFTAEKEWFQDPKIDGVFGAIGVHFLSDKGQRQFQEKFKGLQLTTLNYHAEGYEIFEGLTGVHTRLGTFFSLIALTLKREVILRNELRFNETLRVHQDQDFIVKLSFCANLKTGIIDRAVALRGVHDNNRITQIKNYSKEYNNNQYLYWKSLYEWQKNRNIKPYIRKHIRRKYHAFQIGTKSGMRKMATLIIRLIQDPLLLKTRYRFHFKPFETRSN